MNQDIQPSTEQTPNTNDASQQFTPNSTPAVAPAPPPAKPAKAGGAGKMLYILLALLLIVGAGAAGFFYGKTKAPTQVVTKTAPLPSLTLPQGATLLSKCTPGYGAQYALAKDLPNGPYYSVYQNNVIAYEYMIGEADLTTNMQNFLNHPVDFAKYDHIDVTYAAKGHAGFTIPHFHISLFTVPASVSKGITCSTSTSGTSGTSSTSTTTSTTSGTTSTTTTPSTTTSTTTTKSQ